MAPQLWLLRHGEAVPHDSKPDDERELTAVGERQALAAGEGLARLGAEFEACYASPRRRALDTARLVCRALNVEPVVEESLGGGFDRDDARALLHAHGDDARVLVVGHEPDFSQLVYDVTGGRVALKKGGIAAVEGSGLVLLLRPRELESLARGVARDTIQVSP